EFTPAGGAPSQSWVIPVPISGSHSGIAFDENGSFGNAIVMTFSDGSAWKFDSTHTATKIGNFPAALDTEGPKVAPASFYLPGQIVATQEATNSILAMNTAGVTTLVTTAITAPEGVHFIPPQTCALNANAAAGSGGLGVFFTT